jgi:hypothetical protein
MWRLDTDPVSQGQTVTAAPSGGEQAALRGYKWQYDHIAVMVYDSLIEDDVVSLSLADPEAGQVDDLVLVRRGRMDAFQFKSSGGDTFGSTSHSEGGQVARTCVRWTSGGPRRGAVRGKRLCTNSTTAGLTTAEHRPKLTRSSKGQRERDIDNRHCRSGGWLTVCSPQPNRLVMFPVRERIKLRPSRVFAGRFFVKIPSS